MILIRVWSDGMGEVNERNPPCYTQAFIHIQLQWVKRNTNTNNTNCFPMHIEFNRFEIKMVNMVCWLRSEHATNSSTHTHTHTHRSPLPGTKQCHLVELMASIYIHTQYTNTFVMHQHASLYYNSIGLSPFHRMKMFTRLEIPMCLRACVCNSRWIGIDESSKFKPSKCIVHFAPNRIKA